MFDYTSLVLVCVCVCVRSTTMWNSDEIGYRSYSSRWSQMKICFMAKREKNTFLDCLGDYKIDAMLWLALAETTLSNKSNRARCKQIEIYRLALVKYGVDVCVCACGSSYTRT